MIWLSAIDSGPDDLVDERPRNAYLSRRDIRILGIVAVLFIIVMLPIYAMMKRKTEKHVCLTNVREIGKAMLLYAQQNNDMLPPTHVVEYGATGAPYIENGRALTWVTVVSEYMSRRNDFQCPSARREEAVVNSGLEPRSGEHGDVLSHYGMFGPYGGYPVEFVERPSEAVLLTETSNLGSRETYDPVPFVDSEGKVSPYDGFVVGWDTGNFGPEDETRSVTRLSYFGTKDGKFTIDKPGRHDEGNHFLFLDTHYEVHRAPIAEVKMRMGEPTGIWSTPPVSATR